jgi:hypothetical protein
MMTMLATERCTGNFCLTNNFDGFKKKANQMATNYGMRNKSKTKRVQIKMRYFHEPSAEEQYARNESENFKRHFY